MDTALTRRTLMRRAGTGLAAAAAGSALLPAAPAFGAAPAATRSRITGPLSLQMQAIADAAVAALMSRDRHGSMPNYQVLVYPITNYAFNTPSYLQNAVDAPFLTRAAMMWFWQQYLRTPADGASPYASPLRAPSLSGLPPATIINGNDDVLRSDGEEYAVRLRLAGVPTTRTLYTGVSHEFFSMSIALLPARLAVAEAAAAIKAAIKAAAPTGKG